MNHYHQWDVQLIPRRLGVVNMTNISHIYYIFVVIFHKLKLMHIKILHICTASFKAKFFLIFVVAYGNTGIIKVLPVRLETKNIPDFK